MRKLAKVLSLIALTMGVTWAAAVTYTIPPEQLDAKKVFWGQTANFERPGEVDYEAVIKATPEYGELKSKKVEKGTGKYWILLSKASDRAVHAISSFGEDTEYDLIAARGYLESLQPAIPSENVTKLIIKSMDDTKSSKKTARSR